MTLEGLEMVAVLVVLVLFVKVLEQFGLFEPVSLEGNPGSWAYLSYCLGTGLCYLHARVQGEQVSERRRGKGTSGNECWEQDSGEMTKGREVGIWETGRGMERVRRTWAH